MDEEQIRQKVEARVKAKMGFYHNLVTYLIVNAILALINLVTSPQHLWFYWVSIFWGIAIVYQFLQVFVFPEQRMQEMKERMVEREMNRERERQEVAGNRDDQTPTT